MNTKTHKIVAGILNFLVIAGSFYGLLAILNLNEAEIFWRTAFIVGLFYILQILLMYDLHFKTPGSFKRAKIKHENISSSFHKEFKIWTTAFWDRIEHLRKWSFLSKWLNYIILPGIIFWSTLSIFYIHFGFWKLQQIFAVLSIIALFLYYYFLKQVFISKQEQVESKEFIALSVVKIYASAIMYGASLSLVKRYCLNPDLLALGVFALTFLLIWQALYQHKKATEKNIAITVAISFIMSQLASLVLVNWGYNHFTAAVFLATCYNFMWGVFHYKLDKALTKKAFLEIFFVSLIILAMLFFTTNFKARLIDDCHYRQNYKLMN